MRESLVGLCGWIELSRSDVFGPQDWEVFGPPSLDVTSDPQCLHKEGKGQCLRVACQPEFDCLIKIS